MSGPYAHDAAGRNQAIHPPEYTPIPDDLSTVRLAVQAELEVPADRAVDALRARWPSIQVDVEILPLQALMALDQSGRSARWDAVLLNRVGLSEDLAPLLLDRGDSAFFQAADNALHPLLRDHSVFGQQQLHAALADHSTHLFLVELQGLAAWRTSIQPVWMTPVDGLGRLSAWGFSR